VCGCPLGLRRLVTPEPGRGQIGHFGTSNNVRAGNDPPAARVTRHGSVITENEVSTAWVASPAPGFVTAVSRPKIRLIQQCAVDEDASALHRDGLSGQADDPFEEGPAAVTRSFDLRRTLEEDDVASFGFVEPVDEAVGDDSVGDSRLAAADRFGAVEGRLHRRRRDSIRLCDFGLEDEQTGDSQRDCQRPVFLG
jgi:hypothetical protein